MMRFARGLAKGQVHRMKKYIFVTGGVVSGLGKGITAASLGRLLKARGLRVVAQKLESGATAREMVQFVQPMMAK